MTQFSCKTSVKNPSRTWPLILTFAFGLCGAWAPLASAAKFTNQFIEFELPPQWQCVLEGAEWVCQSTDEGKKRDAIIVMAAKIKGDQDSLDQYQAYLQAPKVYTSPQGKSVKSEPKYAKFAKIGEQSWIDSLHLESEIPGFFTRYLATVKQDIAVLVTYSINKGKYNQYLNDFETMVNTLKVFKKPGAINAAGQNTNLFANASIPSHVESSTVFPSAVAPSTGSDNKKKKSSDDDSGIALIAIGGAVVAFILWRRRQRGG